MYIQIKVYDIRIDQNDCSTYFKGIIDLTKILLIQMINIKRKYIVLNNYFSIFPEEFDTHFVLQKTMETRDEQNRTRVKSGNLSLSTAHHPTHAHTYICTYVEHGVETLFEL